MASRSRTRVAAFASATMLGMAAVLGGAPVAAAAPEPAVVPGNTGLDERTATRVDWQPCADAPGVQCGTLTVPIDWNRPDGGTIDLALARRPATDPARRIGSLVINPGGPGGSGVDVVKYDHAFPSADLQQRFDIVGFDPRGVGASSPLLCPAVPSLPAPAEFPTTPATFAALKRFNQVYAEDCRRLTGPVFGYLDTLSVVQDLDAIRAAVGDSRLTYYGVSYGTLIGQQYAQRYPNRVRALVADSNMDHSISSAWRFMRTEATGVEESFDEFVAWCQRSTECVLHGQDVRQVFRQVRAKVAAGGVVYPGTDLTVTPILLLRVVTSALYGPEWRGLAELLVVLRDDAAPTAAVARLAPESTPTVTARGGQAAVPDPLLILCHDWRLPVRSAAELAGYRAALRLVAPDMTLSPLGWLVPVSCVGLEDLHRNPHGPLSLSGKPSVLMLTSRYDPSTPYEWTMTAARQSGVRVLHYDGWGHGAYFKNSSCVVSATDNYLITTRLPSSGTHCPAVEPANGLTKQLPVVPIAPRMWG
ncbi:alpha/beta fold hydrolase [Micromonospora sonneratiae]|uniref:Alpha/beta fold hydrolase n=1 Tax=Micromonospora sonneratiae TaxID=1184706 RepID=A0ABW3YBP0_9ACTN